jgi:hypothetical protein
MEPRYRVTQSDLCMRQCATQICLPTASDLTIFPTLRVYSP